MRGTRSARSSSNPALELTRTVGSVLSLATDGVVAFLVWTDSLGESFQSVGGGKEALVFDYFGSWSEAPACSLVALSEGLRCLRSFVDAGTPVTAESSLSRPDPGHMVADHCDLSTGPIASSACLAEGSPP